MLLFLTVNCLCFISVCLQSVCITFSKGTLFFNILDEVKGNEILWNYHLFLW